MNLAKAIELIGKWVVGLCETFTPYILIYFTEGL